jgi:hypothetical protein
MNENVFLFQVTYCGSASMNRLLGNRYCARARCISHSDSSELPPHETY